MELAVKSTDLTVSPIIQTMETEDVGVMKKSGSPGQIRVRKQGSAKESGVRTALATLALLAGFVRICSAESLSGTFDYSGYGTAGGTAQFTYDTVSNSGVLTNFAGDTNGNNGTWTFYLEAVPYGAYPNIQNFSDLTNFSTRQTLDGGVLESYNYDWVLQEGTFFRADITGRDIYGTGGAIIPITWGVGPPLGSFNYPSYAGTVTNIENTQQIPEPSLSINLALCLAAFCIFSRKRSNSNRFVPSPKDG